MKLSLALGPSKPLSRQTAWRCLTANLALPGSGSLAAGRVSGYGQLVLAFAGLLLSTVFGLRFIAWSVSNWSRLYGAQAEPFESLTENWHVLRWALFGIGVFGLGCLWALVTSLQILREAKNAEPPKSTPPVI